jgi:hypothetical protein
MVLTETQAAGLRFTTGAPIPLRGVDFQAVIRDMGAQVTVRSIFKT